MLVQAPKPKVLPMEALRIAFLRQRLRALAEPGTPTQRAALQQFDSNPITWVRNLFPSYVGAEMAARHRRLWEWAWAIERGVKPRPFIGIWPRGGAKSTTGEAATVSLGARKRRKFCLYVCETQPQADDHLGNISTMCESQAVAHYYPLMGDRLLSKFSASRGWTQQKLRTASGFSLISLGLDTAARGVKLDEQRPDLIILDDLDSEHDSAGVTAKKVKTLTTKILPAGSKDCAVLGLQNLVHENGIFAQLADTRADFLTARIVDGPHKAVDNLVYEQRQLDDGQLHWTIIGGDATWQGQDLAVCEAQMNEWGRSAFLREAQHEVEAPPGGMFDHLDYRHCEWDQVPELVHLTVLIDPAVTDTDDSDAHGIQADGLGVDGKIYRLWSWEARTSPTDAMRRGILKAVELGAESVGVETNQGGDTWESVYELTVDKLRKAGEIGEGARLPTYYEVKASTATGSKVARASLMLTDYEQGQIIHVLSPTTVVLERALRRFPKTKPFDLVDAAYWAWDQLRHGTYFGRVAVGGQEKVSIWNGQ